MNMKIWPVDQFISSSTSVLYRLKLRISNKDENKEKENSFTFQANTFCTLGIQTLCSILVRKSILFYGLPSYDPCKVLHETRICGI